MKTLIRVVDLWKKYHDIDSSNAAALRGASLSVISSKLIVIYGKVVQGRPPFSISWQGSIDG